MLEWRIVVDRRGFTSGYCTMDGEEEDGKIMDEPSDGVHHKQKHGRNYGQR